MGKKITVFCMIMLLGINIYADVIRLRDGRILLGKLIAVDGQGIIMEAFGEKIKVNHNDIIKSETDFSSLKDQELEITLKDNSVMRGKIKDYDQDVGFLIEINFGIITIPLENVKIIEDPLQKNKQFAYFVQIGTQGGYYFMIGDLSEVFSSNFNVNVFSEFNLDFLLQGLFAGATISYHNISCNAENYTYLLFNGNVNIIYRFLFFRTQSWFIKNLVPFIYIGGGAALPLLTYGDETRSEVDLSFSGSIGIDYFILDNVLIRLNGVWMSILQSELWFNSIAINLGAAYCF